MFGREDRSVTGPRQFLSLVVGFSPGRLQEMGRGQPYLVSVAQIGNLLFRRLPVGEAPISSQVVNLRHGRLPVCAIELAGVTHLLERTPGFPDGFLGSSPTYLLEHGPRILPSHFRGCGNETSSENENEE